MNTTIFYYTGTGNSLWVARRLAEQLGGANLVPIAYAADADLKAAGRTVGLVFPVYIWGVPAPVIDFVGRLAGLEPDYLFAVAVNGGQVSRTLVQLKKLLAARGLELASGFDIKMPSNYIPWGGPGPAEEQRRLFDAAQTKIMKVAETLKSGENRPVEKGPLWQRVFFTLIYWLCFPYVPKMDGRFWADDKCTGCGICAKVCPAANIAFEDGRPVWQHRCQQCFACLQWCPEEAIQYGRKTPRYERYHQPEIVLRDMLNARGKKVVE